MIGPNSYLSENLRRVMNVADVGSETIEVFVFAARSVDNEAGQQGRHQVT